MFKNMRCSRSPALWNRIGLAVAGTLLGAAPNAAMAYKTWVGELSNWTLFLDNGVAYVQSATIPSNCSYNRAQIATWTTVDGSSTYERDIYAFVLASYTTGKTLNIEIETTETTCIVYGVQN